MRIADEAKLLFSLKEAAALSRLSADKLRREIERDVIEPKSVRAGLAHRLRFGEPEILYFAMLKSLAGTLELTRPTRATACRLLRESQPRRPPGILDAWTMIHKDAEVRSEWVNRLNRDWSSSINAVLMVNWDALIREVGPRIELYRDGLTRLRVDEEILGGEPVFAGTRLAVRHIGGMRAKGEPVARILEDYPELTADDVEFARLYWEAHPLVGRPKAGAAA